MGVFKQLSHAWNAFLDQADYARYSTDLGPGYSTRPDRVRLRLSNERSIISAIYLRLALDLANVDIRHVKLDEQGRYKEDAVSGLQNCLTLESNIDQAAQAFFIDAYLTMFDEGAIALVPIDTDINPDEGMVDIETWRVGKIVQWFPQHVRVDVYNDKTGRREQVTMKKKNVGIIENPLYTVMNEPNSTLQRLIRKLNLLDQIDEKNSANKLDLIIQLPYLVKTESKRKLAEQRRRDIEFQLTGSQHGIAYTDGSEKVVQLNRPVENNLLKQVEYLMNLLYSQLGLTPEIMLGTATEEAMLNYNSRTLKIFLNAMTQEIKRKFLSKNARTRGHSIDFFRDPFQLVPMKDLAEMADKFTRNEIVTSNEFRGFIGLRPSSDPKADQLRNSNMPDESGSVPQAGDEQPAGEEDDPYAGLDAAIDDAFKTVEELTNAG